MKHMDDFNKSSFLDKARKSIDEILVSAKSALKKFEEQIKSKFQNKSASVGQRNADSAQDQNSAAESPASANFSATEINAAAQNNQTPTSLGRTIALAILGVIASLVFVAAIIIAIKPSLLEGKLTAPEASYSTVVKKVGNIILKIETTKTTAATAAQMFFVGLGLIIFGAIKALVLLAAKSGTKKIVSALTLAMTYLACFMISDKFLLFSIFILLLYFTFDYSCGFSTRIVLIKLGVIVVSAIVIYVAVHFAIDKSLPQAAQKIYEGLRLPISRWW